MNNFGYRAMALGALVLSLTAGAVFADEGEYFIGTSTIEATSSTGCNFNGTAIPCPRYIWFTAVGKLMTPSAVPVKIFAKNQHITFTANAVNYNLTPADGVTFFNSAATTATTIYASGWQTEIPSGASGNQFYAAMGWAVPCPNGLPGGVSPVTWSIDFYADKPGVNVSWTWAAAVYTSFGPDASVSVKATDDNHYAPYANSDHAGTPENYTANVTGGATGGGGSNYTGSLCSSKTVPDLPIPTAAASWGAVKSMYRK